MKLKEIRKKLGLTLIEAAELTGIGFSYIARMDRGEVKGGANLEKYRTFLTQRAKAFNQHHLIPYIWPDTMNLNEMEK